MPDRSVAIVDDHPLLVEGVSALLKRRGGFTVAAIGTVADHIVSITEAHHPDDIIVDLNMLGDVFEAISDAAKIAPGTNIIVFTASANTDNAIKALDAGAKGYVLKGSPGEDLFQALHAAQQGEVYISPSFATKVISALQGKALERQKAISNSLSVREEQIVKRLLRGLSLSAKTVKGYITNPMASGGGSGGAKAECSGDPPHRHKELRADNDLTPLSAAQQPNSQRVSFTPKLPQKIK